MVTRVASAVVTALALAAMTACGATHTPGPATPNLTTPTTPTTSQSGPSAVTTTPHAGPPSLTVTPAATQQLGAATVDSAWRALAAWIVTNGFRPDLIATTHPDDSALQPVYNFMTATAAQDLRNKVAAVYDGTDDPSVVQAIETITTIGATVPGFALITGAAAVDNVSIDTASAAIDDAGQLAITATSRAVLHFAATDNSGAKSHADYRRTVTYTLVQAGASWAIDRWNGTYDSSTPTPE